MPRALKPFALVLLLVPAGLAPSPARADCEVSGVATLPRLEVGPPGERAHTLSVVDLPVAVRPGRGSLYRDVRVLAPLAFTARTGTPIPWGVPRPATVADGMLYWGPTVEVEDVRETPRDELLVRAQVDEGVWISRLHLPCDAVRVGRGEGVMEAPPWASQRGPRWQPRGDDLWLQAEPGQGATLRLDAPDGLPGALVEVGRRPGWVHVLVRFSSGAALRGWAREQQLELASDRPGSPPWTAPAPGVTAPCARRASDSDEYVGPAELVPTTPVRTSPEGRIWAAVAGAGPFTIAWRQGSPWARILYVAGLRSDGRCPDVLHRAWVPRSAVRLQGEPRRPVIAPSDRAE